MQVCKGREILSPLTTIEKEKLKGLLWLGEYRLACQTWVGDGVTNGDLHVNLE